ncbi:hypothetical protein [Larkinella harenae]
MSQRLAEVLGDSLVPLVLEKELKDATPHLGLALQAQGEQVFIRNSNDGKLGGIRL